MKASSFRELKLPLCTCFMNKSLFFSLVVLLANALYARQPNIIFFFCDDLGWGDLGAYGNTVINTPHIDGLARDGMRLTQFYVNSPVCSPSRAALLTGRNPSEIGIHYAIGGSAGRFYNSCAWLDEELTTIYDVFQAAGYRTGHFGKWHIGHEANEAGEMPPPPAAYGLDVSGTTHSTGPGFVKKGERMTNANKSELLGKRGAEFVNEYKDEPFFLSLWIMDPHSVLDPTEEQMKPYLKHTHDQVIDHYRSSLTVYYAIISAIDKAVGEVVQAVEDNGLAEDTIIIFSSDNGPSPLWSAGTGHAGAGSSGPFRGVKSSLYEGGIRVPFIVKWPGQTPANVVDDRTVMAAVDMLPTLPALAGIETPELGDIDGENLAAALLGEVQQRERPLFWDYRFGAWGRAIQNSPRLAMRDGDWKLMLNPDGSRVELYNLKEDPSETSNCAAYEMDRVEAMRSQLLRWMETDVMDPERVPNWSGSKGWRYPVSGDLK